MATITADNVRALSKTAAPRIISGIVDNQQTIVDGGIDTPLRLCHFMAQLAHESAHFQVTREFASGQAYEGRKDLGNTQLGDGQRYRGRGLIQTTGRANYRQATTAIRKMNPNAPDFEADPVAARAIPVGAAGRDNLLAEPQPQCPRRIGTTSSRVTKRINGGTNGLADRKQYLAKAKAIWMTGAAPQAAPATAHAHPTLRKGDSGA